MNCRLNGSDDDDDDDDDHNINYDFCHHRNQHHSRAFDHTANAAANCASIFFNANSNVNHSVVFNHNE